MLTPTVFAMLPGRRPLQRYRSSLAQTIQADPAIRLLPALLDIPLACAPLPDPEAILAAPTSVALLAPPAGGRTLALFQIAARWAEGSCRAPLACLPLSELDSPNLSPRAIVAGALHRAGARATVIDQRQPALLLVDEWEQLPANRRLLWRQYLTSLAEAWPAARAVVALPAAEAWPELQALRLTPPDDAALAVWFGRLLPNHDPAPLHAALAATSLAILRENLADLLLLALVYPIAGLPNSRAALYEQAFALVQPMLSEPPQQPALDAEPLPAEPLDTPLRIGRAALRHYRLARSLAGGADLVTLADLPAPERAAVAPLAAGLLDDPTPVLDLLWRTDATPDLNALVACARERPDAAPPYTLHLLNQLGDPAQADQIAGLASVLPRLLSAAARQDLPATLAVVPTIAPFIPNGLPWLSLLDTASAPIMLRWAAVDLLAAAPPPAAVLAAAAPEADRVSLAGRAYLSLHIDPPAYTQLQQPPLAAGLAALLDLAADHRRRSVVARRLLTDPATPPALRRQALAAAPPDAADDTLIEAALGDPDADLRRAARTRLLSGAPADALAGITRTLARPDLPAGVAQELLSAAAQLDDPGVVKLLARCAVTTQQPLTVRLEALEHLTGLGASGHAALMSLLTIPALPEPVRATIVRHLGACGRSAALPHLRRLLDPAEAPSVRRAAVAALADLVRRPATHDAALATLLALLQRPQLDREVTITALNGLAAASPSVALPALAARLDSRYPAALARIWLHAIPQLADTPASEWLSLPLPAAVHAVLADALAVGATPADQPTSLGELAANHAHAEALAAIAGLLTIARREPPLIPAVQARLRRALNAPEHAGLAEALLDALAHLTPDSGIAELARLLDDPATPLNLRWRAIDTLGRLPGVAEGALARLQRGADDPFTQSKLVTLLGAHAPTGALSVLRQIADNQTNPAHVRRAALRSLGDLDDPAAVGALVRALTEEVAPELRVQAANALPGGLSTTICRTLRDLLRTERDPAALAAIVSALGRAGDREAVPLLLRYTQSEHAPVAQAAIESVAAVGDANLASPLVRVSQNTLAAPHVRLAAVCALIQLCGDEFVALLRDYLNSPQLTLRLRAHAALAAHQSADPRLITPIADPAAPLALRLEALQRLAARMPNEPVLRLVLANPAETPQLRLAAAAALARADDPAVVAVLADGAAAAALPLLQRRCIESLAVLAQAGAAPAAAAQAALETIGASGATPALRHWAAMCLNVASRRR